MSVYDVTDAISLDGSPVVGSVEKVCRTCHETKPLSYFGKHYGFKDGLNIHCKECVNERQRAARVALREGRNIPPLPLPVAGPSAEVVAERLGKLRAKYAGYTIPDEATCGLCGQRKSALEFFVDKAHKRLQAWCRSCTGRPSAFAGDATTVSAQTQQAQTQQCKVCKEAKPPSAFGVSLHNKPLLTCKACVTDRLRGRGITSEETTTVSSVSTDGRVCNVCGEAKPEAAFAHLHHGVIAKTCKVCAGERMRAARQPKVVEALPESAGMTAYDAVGTPVSAPTLPRVKKCEKCRLTKSVDEFDYHAIRPDHLTDWCHQCLQVPASAPVSVPSAAKVTEKYCPACHTLKPLDAFHRSILTMDGRAKMCIACTAAAMPAARSTASLNGSLTAPSAEAPSVEAPRAELPAVEDASEDVGTIRYVAAAVRLGVSEDTVRSWVQRLGLPVHQGPVHRFGRPAPMLISEASLRRIGEVIHMPVRPLPERTIEADLDGMYTLAEVGVFLNVSSPYVRMVMMTLGIKPKWAPSPTNVKGAKLAVISGHEAMRVRDYVQPEVAPITPVAVPKVKSVAAPPVAMSVEVAPVIATPPSTEAVSAFASWLDGDDDSLWIAGSHIARRTSSGKLQIAAGGERISLPRGVVRYLVALRDEQRELLCRLVPALLAGQRVAFDED